MSDRAAEITKAILAELPAEPRMEHIGPVILKHLSAALPDTCQVCSHPDHEGAECRKPLYDDKCYCAFGVNRASGWGALASNSRWHYWRDATSLCGVKATHFISIKDGPAPQSRRTCADCSRLRRVS